MKILFLFLDGVGLGEANPDINPLAGARMPNLEQLLGGRKLVHTAAPVETERATLLALDATLGVRGLPQSATGQTVLLTGRNVPSELGYHYGPKPNPAVAEYVRNGNLFAALKSAGKKVSFLNAYPPRYFAGVTSGRRLYSAIPLAATSAGLRLLETKDLKAGRALAADFTAQGWRSQLGLIDTPVLAPSIAGEKLGLLASEVDFALFEYWLSDYAGHRQEMQPACDLLEELDEVLGGLVSSWDDEGGLILITSDHGNLEDLSTRRHTLHPVPALLIGAPDLRRSFAHGLNDLTGIAPAILRSLLGS